MLVRHVAGDAEWNETERGLDVGARSLRDVLARQAALVRGELAEVAALLRREIAVDPAFAPFVGACREHGIPVTIVSSGLDAIVRDRLREIGLDDLPVIANAVDARPDGWTIRFRDDVANGTDKAAVLRAARADGTHTVFVGDGRSDYDAAREADVRFAKRGLDLESYLMKLDIPFEPFATFADVRARCATLGIVP